MFSIVSMVPMVSKVSMVSKVPMVPMVLWFPWFHGSMVPIGSYRFLRCPRLERLPLVLMVFKGF